MAHSRTTLCAFFGSTNSRLSQPSSQDFADPSPVRLFCRASGLFVLAHTGSLSRMLQRPASCLTLSADDGLPVSVSWNKPTASEPSTTYDLPLYHKPCWCVACVFVCMRVFCNNFCSVCVYFHLCSLYCQAVYFPMSLLCILCSYNCTAFYAFYAFYAWWFYFPQSGALADTKRFFLSTALFDTLYLLVIAFAFQ